MLHSYKLYYALQQQKKSITRLPVSSVHSIDQLLDAADGAQIVAVLPHIGRVHDTQTFQLLVETAQKLGIKCVKLLIVLQMVCSQCALRNVTFPYFVCVYCKDKVVMCASCEASEIGGHLHPMTKINNNTHQSFIDAKDIQEEDLQEEEEEEDDDLEEDVDANEQDFTNQEPKKLQCQFVSYSSKCIPPKAMVETGQSFNFGWVLRNNGASSWDDDLHLACEQSEPLSLLLQKHTIIPAIEANQEIEVIGTFLSPKVVKPTFVKSFWRLQCKGQSFGQRFRLEVDVIPKNMGFLERQIRRIENLGFKDHSQIEFALSQSGGNTEEAVLLLAKAKNAENKSSES